MQVTLLHILSGLPPAFWDDGHVLQEKEREARQRLVASWQQEQEKKWQDLVNKAHALLTKAGLAKDAVANKFKPKDYDVAEDIINEAQAGNSTPWSWVAGGWGWPKPCSWEASPARWWRTPKAAPSPSWGNRPGFTPGGKSSGRIRAVQSKPREGDPALPALLGLAAAPAVFFSGASHPARRVPHPVLLLPFCGECLVLPNSGPDLAPEENHGDRDLLVG